MNDTDTEKLRTEIERIKAAFRAFIETIIASDREESAKALNEGRPARQHQGSIRRALEALNAKP